MGACCRAIGELFANNDYVDELRLVATLARRDSGAWLSTVLGSREEPAWQALRGHVTHRYNRDLPKEQRIA